MSLNNIYQQDLLDHYQHPKNFGILPKYDFISPIYNPSCGDSVTICGIIHNRTIVEISFEGKGCILSVAMASKLTEFAKGKTIDTLLEHNEELVEQLLKMELGIKRMQCGMLSIMALQKGITLYLAAQS